MSKQVYELVACDASIILFPTGRGDKLQFHCMYNDKYNWYVEEDKKFLREFKEYLKELDDFLGETKVLGCSYKICGV